MSNSTCWKSFLNVKKAFECQQSPFLLKKKKIKKKKIYSNQIYFYSLIKINFNFKIMELANKTSFKDLIYIYIYIYGVGARLR